MLRRNWIKSSIEELQEGRFFGGSFGGDTDVTSRVEPWSAAKPHFERLYNLASEAYDQTDKNPYPGDFFAGENGFDIQARSQVSYAAEQMGPDAVITRMLGRGIVQGEFLDPSSNIILKDSVDVAVQKAEDTLLEDVMPQVLDIAIKSGAYSGTGTELIIDRAVEGFSREALRATTGIYYENYTRERSLMPGGVEMLKVAEIMDYEKGKLIQANADMLRAVRQIALDEALRDFEDEQKAHWRGMDQYMSIMTGGGFHADTKGEKKNVLGSALQGAVGGASLGASVGGGPGAIVGGILGGVAGLLG